MAKNKLYTVNIDLVWSQDFTVSAKTEAEARKKAWKRFKRYPHKKDFRIEADRIDD